MKWKGVIMHHLIAIASVLVLVASLVTADDQTAQVRGKVVDEKGHPIAGATVFAYWAVLDSCFAPRMVELGRVPTKPDGTFQISLKLEGYDPQGIIAAVKEGMAFGWEDWTKSGRGELVIKLGPPKELSGTVVDEQGKPLAGIEVRPIVLQTVVSPSSNAFPCLPPIDWAVAKTDEQGFFRLVNIPAWTRAGFLLRAPGRTTTWSGRAVELRGLRFTPGQKDIRLTLPVEGRVEGTVVRKDTGAPLAGIKVTVMQTDLALVAPAVSDNDGKFVIHGLPAGQLGIQLAPAPSTLPDWVAEEAHVTIEAGKTTTAKIEAVKGAVIEVAVADKVTARPLPDSHVFLTLDQPGGDQVQGLRAYTNGRGLARFRALPGKYQVYAYADNYAEMQGPQEEIEAEEGKTQRIDLKFEPLPRVKGVVKDPAGKPIAGANVAEVPFFLMESGPATDDEGRFEMASHILGHSDEPLRLLARQEERGLVILAEIEDPNQLVEIALKPGVTLTGLVAGPDGKPVPDAQVQVDLNNSEVRVMHRSFPTVWATTDEKGIYQVKALLAGRDYVVSALADGYGPDETTVSIGEDQKEPVKAEKIILKLADKTVSGKVVDVDDKPVANAYVDLWQQGRWDYLQIRRGAMTDKDGKFVFDKVPEGQVNVSVYVLGKPLYYGSATTEAGDKDVTVTIEMNEDSSQPSRRVTRPASRDREDF